MSKNYRNGYSKKSVKTQLGKMDVKIPRDRNGEYEPKIITKYDHNADGIEEKILGLYACGMSRGAGHSHGRHEGHFRRLVDLKPVYQAINEEESMVALLRFTEKWGKQYPSCVKSWNDNWDILSTFFAYPAELRKIIYTTNIIESCRNWDMV